MTSTVTKKAVRPFGAKDKVGYMFGDFGCNMTFQLISFALIIFVTQALRIDPIHWSILILIAKLFDAINDPLIGALIDRVPAGKHGKYLPWIFFGSFAIAIATTLLFIDVRAFSYWGRWCWVLFMYMLWSIAYTFVNVPYGSLNAAVTDDPSGRASLSSLRTIGAGLAMLPVNVLVPMFIFETSIVDGAEVQTVLPQNFVWVGLACGLVAILGFMITVFMTKERFVMPATKEKSNYFKTLGSFFKNRAIIALSIASLAQIVFLLSYSQTMPLVLQYFFKTEKSMISMSNILVMIPMLVYIPFIGKLIRKYGSKKICTWPNLVGIVVLAIMMCIDFPRTGAGAWVYLGFLMIGLLGSGTFLLAVWSMVADCVDYQEVKSGHRDEASIYATYSFVRKLAQGIGAALVGAFLGLVGYTTDENLTVEAMTSINTSPEVAGGMLKLSILLPLIGFILVFIIFLLVYNLDKDDVLQNNAFLRAKHANMGQEIVTTKAFYDEDNASLLEEEKVNEKAEK